MIWAPIGQYTAPPKGLTHPSKLHHPPNRFKHVGDLDLNVDLTDRREMDVTAGAGLGSAGRYCRDHRR